MKWRQDASRIKKAVDILLRQADVVENSETTRELIERAEQLMMEAILEVGISKASQ